MSTAVAEPTAPLSNAGAPISLAESLYGSSPVAENSPRAQPTSTPSPEHGSATPPSESVAPAGTVAHAPQKEAEAEQTTVEAEKAKTEESHRQAARKLGREVQELKQHLAQLTEENATLRAKVDGTYEDPPQQTAEQIAEMAKLEGREMASRELANQRYGEEVVQARIYDPGSEYKTLAAAQPWLHVRVMQSPQPTIEAMAVLDEYAFKTKYGNDPTQWKAKIIADAKPAIVEEFKKTLHAPPVGAAAPSVTQARGDGGPTALPKTLAQLMYGTPTRDTP